MPQLVPTQTISCVAKKAGKYKGRKRGIVVWKLDRFTCEWKKLANVPLCSPANLGDPCPALFYDAMGDDHIAADDVVTIINYINAILQLSRRPKPRWLKTQLTVQRLIVPCY